MPQLQENPEKDPYYIPSVPMYKRLDDEFLDMDDTIGDKFFDHYSELATHTPQREIFDRDYREQQEARNKEKNADKENAVVEPAPTENIPKPPLVRRRSRSLIKPGRPSVGNKPAPPTTSVGSKPVPSTTTTVANSSPTSTNRSIQPAPTQPKPIPPKSLPQNTMKSAMAGASGVFATKQSTYSPKWLRSSKIDSMNTSKSEQETRNMERNALKENAEVAENIPKPPLVRRRSRSLIKPGRPSVGNRPAPPTTSVDNKPAPTTTTSVVNSSPISTHRPTQATPTQSKSTQPKQIPSNPTQPKPIQPKSLPQNTMKTAMAGTTGVFATKQSTYSPMRLRSSKKDPSITPKSGSTPSANDGPNPSAVNNNNYKPPAMRRVSGNYMAPTISSARRLSDVKDRRRSRLGP